MDPFHLGINEGLPFDERFEQGDRSLRKQNAPTIQQIMRVPPKTSRHDPRHNQMI
jgi:hypothetical protein